VFKSVQIDGRCVTDYSTLIKDINLLSIVSFKEFGKTIQKVFAIAWLIIAIILNTQVYQF